MSTKQARERSPTLFSIDQVCKAIMEESDLDKVMKHIGFLTRAKERYENQLDTDALESRLKRVEHNDTPYVKAFIDSLKVELLEESNGCTGEATDVKREVLLDSNLFSMQVKYACNRVHHGETILVTDVSVAGEDLANSRVESQDGMLWDGVDWQDVFKQVSELIDEKEREFEASYNKSLREGDLPYDGPSDHDVADLAVYILYVLQFLTEEKLDI